ncbi:MULTISPECIES: esterase-like activity of phytase family protein [Rhodomicrobium]|uniref:esterase-like activity of phytase family protein n=1 Tax=Rhodomicrobium TaxID=1068 RepID=UPI0014820EC3|nr:MULTISPECIES: esterase-like activity of phytase family protein [Rhodomicrobium]
MASARLRGILRDISPRTLVLSAVLVIGGIIAAAAAQKADIAALRPQAITVSAKPFDFDRANPEQKTFGRLEWRGGLILSSSSEFFGGYSDIALSADGEKLLMISDAGSWLSATIEHKDGRLSGLGDARIGPIPQKDGRPLQRTRDRDSESLVALRPGGIEGRYLIGFEGRHRIEEYVFEKGAMRGPVGGIALPDQLKRMSRNAGLEGMTMLRGGDHAGAVVAFAERKLTRDGDHTGAMTLAGKSKPLFLKRHGEFDVVSLAGLKDGSLLILERSFIRATLKLDTRLRLIEARDIRPGAMLEGEVLLEAGRSYMIDNFEGVTATEGENGETLITLISDDNFSFFQSTLLAQFALKRR